MTSPKLVVNADVNSNMSTPKAPADMLNFPQVNLKKRRSFFNEKTPR